MADDLTLKLGAEAQAAIDTLDRVQKSLGGIVSSVKGSSTIFDQFGNTATVVNTKVEETGKKAKGAKEETGALGESVLKLIGAFSASNLIDKGIEQIFEFGKGALEASSRILNLADTTGLSTKAIQQLEYVEHKTGTAMGGLTDAAFKLGVNLSGGQTSVRQAVADIGLSWDKLFAMKPEERLFTVFEALSKMTDESQRNNDAVQLVGKSWKEIAPAAIGNIRAIAAEAHVTSKEVLEGLNQQQAAFRGFMANLQNDATTGLGSVVVGLKSDSWTTKIKTITALLAGDVGSYAGAMQAVNDEVAEHEKKTSEAAASLDHKLIPAEKSYSAQLEEAKAKLAALTPETLANLKAGLALGASTADLSVRTGVAANVIEVLKDKMVASKEAATKAAEAEKKYADAQAQEWSEQVRRQGELQKDAEQDVQAMLKVLADGEKSIGEEYVRIQKEQVDNRAKHTEQSLSDIREGLKAESSLTQQWIEQFGTALDKAQFQADQWQAEQLRLLAPLKDVWPDEYARATAAVGQVGEAMVARAKAQSDAVTHEWRGVGGEIAQTFLKSVEGGGNPIDSVLTMLGGKMGSSGGAQNMLTQGIKKMFGMGAASAFGGVADMIMPGIGSMLGSLASKGIAAMVNHFKSGALANDLRDQLKAQIGGDASGAGLDAMVKKFHDSAEVQTAYAAFLSAKTKETVQSTFDTLSKALDKAGADAQAATEKIAAALEKIGPAAQSITTAFTAQLSASDKSLREMQDQLKALNEDDTLDAAEKQKQYAELTYKIQTLTTDVVVKNQEEFSRLSRITLAAYDAERKAGKSAVDAMQDLGPAFLELTKAEDSFGFKVNDAYKQLARWNDLVTQNAPLLDQVQALTTLMGALNDTGGMTIDVYKDIEAQGLETYQRMIDAGFSQQEAEAQIEPLLKDIIQLHKEKGYAVDEGTAKLIEQARADGLLKDEQISTNDLLMQGFSAMIEAVGGHIPEAWQKAATAAKDAATDTQGSLDQVKSRVKDVGDHLADKRAWQEWAENAGEAARTVQDEVDAVSFGHSPGGLKEIPLMLAKGAKAFNTWRGDSLADLAAVQRSVDYFAGPDRMVDRFFGPDNAYAPAVGGGLPAGPVAEIPISLQMGDREAWRTFTLQIVNEGGANGEVNLSARQVVNRNARG